MHFLPFHVGFIFCTKAARFKALKQQYPIIVIILPSEREQFGFGGSFLFFDVSSVKATPAVLSLSLCASPIRAAPLRAQRCQRGQPGQRLPRPAHPRPLPSLLRDGFALPSKALQIHVGGTAVLRQGVLQGNKWEQRPGRAKSWRTQFIPFIHWIAELLN